MRAALPEPKRSASRAVEAALGDAAHYLPGQAPLGNFVHHNTLHVLEHMPFHAAVAHAAALFGAEPYLSLERYRAKLASGRIAKQDLVYAASCLYPELDEALPAGLSGASVRLAVTMYGVDSPDESTIRWELTEGILLDELPTELPRVAREIWTRTAARTLRRGLDGGRHAQLLQALERVEGRAALEDCHGSHLDESALSRLVETSPMELGLRVLFAECLRLAPPRRDARVRPTRHRDGLLRLGGLDIDSAIQPALTRWAGAFLDTGLAYWPMPERERGFYVAVRELAVSGSSLPAAWMGRFRAELRRQRSEGLDAAAVVEDRLRFLGLAEESWASFLRATLLALPGWSGMFHRLEMHPEDRLRSLPYRLVDLVAIRLTAECAALTEGLHQIGVDLEPRELLDEEKLPKAPSDDHRIEQAYRLFRLLLVNGVDIETARSLRARDAAALLAFLDRFDDVIQRGLFQEAFEHRYRCEILDGVAFAASAQRALPRVAPKLQVICCIDDREESLRRHLEEIDEEIETFGAAGFYGLAIAYRGLTEAHARALCPASQTPTHSIVEEPQGGAEAWRRRHRLLSWTGFTGHVAARSLVRGLGLSLAGAAEAVPMTLRLLAPRLAHRMRSRLHRTVIRPPATRLHDLREGDEESHGLHAGFTVDEVVPRLAGVLEDMGLVRDFAPLVVVLGHGSTSMNNPHEAAHECGACSGGKGGPNARLFAQLMNRPEVREALTREHGIEVPSTTFFMGGIHDTSDDAVDLSDLEDVPATHAEDLRFARRALDRARTMDAHERCRRFASVPDDASPAAALAHVEARAQDLAEPRPEYGHCTNAICIVGRRSLNRGLFLDRRAFLVSYDPTQDDDGAILERLLASVGPVGAGINLEYYFSTVDQSAYGAGTKLPHNVSGLLGVMDGHESDLRTGLPYQMVDIHEPMRLLTIVEATPERLLEIAEARPAVGRLVANEWIQLVSMDPDTGALARFTGGGFEPYEPNLDVPVMPTSSAHYAGDGNTFRQRESSRVCRSSTMFDVRLALSCISVLAPIVGFLLVCVFAWGRPRPNERLVTGVTRTMFMVGLIAAVGLSITTWTSEPVALVRLGPWFAVGEHVFRLTFLIDRLSAVMVVLTMGACSLIGHFSQTYLHGERGHARFFALLNVFAAGMTILVLAGSLDFLFVGWELVGLTSVLLIGFFHEREAPVRNGLRAFVTYRLCDVSLLVGIILLHHYAAVAEFSPELGPGHWAAGTAHLDAGPATLIALFLIVGAMGKSAQLPVGGWLPRAMEGPTPSSAIFYGALSVHAGVYLLLRAEPLLEDSVAASVAVIAIGSATAVTATLTGRVQTDVKNALAYATMTQVGLMFVEIGLHLHTLAAVHLVGHACLRTWQLLRAPAILHELHTLRGGLDDEFETGRWLDRIESRFPGRLGRFLYQRALDRFYFDHLFDRFLVSPFEALARRLAGVEVSIPGPLTELPPHSEPPALADASAVTGGH